eukprot:scaffold69_cov248-Pinguiococcus_pyrenoidosus.AAC.51
MAGVWRSSTALRPGDVRARNKRERVGSTWRAGRRGRCIGVETARGTRTFPGSSRPLARGDVPLDPAPGLANLFSGTSGQEANQSVVLPSKTSFIGRICAGE